MMSSNMQPQLKQRLERAIQEKVFPGCVLGIVWKNGEKKVMPFGQLTYDSQAAKVKEDTIYDVASITKAVPGALSLLKLIDEGRLSLTDKLVDFVPTFSNFQNKKAVTIQHILTYTLDLDLPPLSSLKNLKPEELMKKVIEAPLKSTPGTVFAYTNATAVFIGLIVQEVTGMRLEDYAKETFFKPLSMSYTTFHPERFNKSIVAPTEIDPWRKKLLQAEVHDESSFVLQKKYSVAIAGLFSAVPDLLVLQDMLLNDGEYRYSKFFSPQTVAMMHTNYIKALGKQTGLGWEMGLESFGTNHSKQAFGKTGFTGCIMLTDPGKEMGFTLLSNRVHPHRPDDVSAITKVRADIANIIFGSV